MKHTQIMNAFTKGTTDAALTNEEKQAINIKNELYRLSLSKNTTFDFEPHSRSSNLGIIKFLRSCDIDPETFIRCYLRQLHPFMINLDKERSVKQDKFSCITDASYRMPLWIEVVTKQFNERVISFHELNWYAKKYDNYYLRKRDLLCIPNDPNVVAEGEKGTFEISVLKGFKSFLLRVHGQRVSENCVRVRTAEFERELLRQCNDSLAEIIESIAVNSSYFPEFQRIKQLSFTSYGDKLYNDVSLLLDLFADTLSPDISAVLFVKLQELSKLPNYPEIIEDLIDKYKNYSNVDFTSLLQLPESEIGDYEDD